MNEEKRVKMFDNDTRSTYNLQYDDFSLSIVIRFPYWSTSVESFAHTG